MRFLQEPTWSINQISKTNYLLEKIWTPTFYINLHKKIQILGDNFSFWKFLHHPPFPGKCWLTRFDAFCIRLLLSPIKEVDFLGVGFDYFPMVDLNFPGSHIWFYDMWLALLIQYSIVSHIILLVLFSLLRYFSFGIFLINNNILSVSSFNLICN